MWNLEYDIYTNELVDKAEIGLQTHRRQTYGYQRGKWAGDKQGVWD